MNANLTIDTLSFNQVYPGSETGPSLRREVSAGVNLPTELKIGHTQFTDSATKLKGIRSMARFDKKVELSTDAIGTVSAYIVVARPNDTAITSAIVLATVQHLISLLQEDDTGLDLMDEIFVNGEM